MTPTLVGPPSELDDLVMRSFPRSVKLGAVTQRHAGARHVVGMVRRSRSPYFGSVPHLSPTERHSWRATGRTGHTHEAAMLVGDELAIRGARRPTCSARVARSMCCAA